MKRLLKVIRNNKIWSGVVGILSVFGAAAYVPAVNVAQVTTQTAVEAYCENNPDSEECKE